MNSKFIAFVLLFLTSCVFAEPALILTGKIGSANKQIVTAPKNPRSLIQIQWLAEDGSLVNKGDLIATFDGSNLQTEIDSLNERIETIELELKQAEITLSQNLLEAEGNVAVAKMRVEQAKIEANVPTGQVSDFDKGKFQLELQRQYFELFKAEEALTLAQQELDSGVGRISLELTQLVERLDYNQAQLSRMSVIAQYTGPVNYALHPWRGEKIDAGINIRSSWQVLDVQAIENFQIESWVHEIDESKLVEGANVDVFFDAYPQKSYSATLIKKSTQIEKKEQLSNSNYYPLIFNFNDIPAFDLLPGMSVRIKV